MANATHPETTPPTADDAELARLSSRALSRLTGRFDRTNAEPGERQQVRLQVHTDGENPTEESVSIPVPAFRLLMDILNQMAQGNAVTIIPVHAELTTQQAAEILNVSRPFVIQLINDKQLPCKMVGTHRRVLLSDLMEYKRKIDADRMKVLEELAAQAQELNLGY